jgi:hypothetical protein
METAGSLKTLEPLRDKLMQRMNTLIGLSDATDRIKDIQAFKDDKISYLLNEKLAGETAGNKFGRPVDNDAIANAYAAQVANVIERRGGGIDAGMERNWKIQIIDFTKEVKDFYDAVDKNK